MKPLIKILIALTLCLTSSFGLYPCGDDDDEGCVYNSHYIGSDYAKNVKSIGNGFIIDLDTMKVYKFSINSTSGGVHNDGDPMPPAGFYIINPYNPNLVVYYKSVTFSFVNNYWGIGALDIPSAEYKTQHYRLYTDCKNEKNSYFNTQTLSCMTCKENEIYNYETKKCELNCKVGEKFNPETGKCESDCGEGEYFDPYTNSCQTEEERPDWCPSPMIFKKIKFDSLKDGHRTLEQCLPDPNIDEDKCESLGMRYHRCDDSMSGVELNACMSYPMGCYSNETAEKINANRQLENDLFVWGGFMLPLPIDSIKNGWSSLTNFFKNLFKNPNPKTPNPNLLEYRPQIVDMKATKNGPEPVWG